MTLSKIYKDIQEPTILILLCLLGNVGVILSSLFLMYKVLVIGKEWLGKSLIYMTIFRYLNPSIFSFDKNIVVLLSYAILIVAFVYAIHFFFTISYVRTLDLFALAVYCSLILLFANLSSEWFLLSFMKLFIFAIGFFTMYVCLNAYKDFDWIRFIVSLLIIILILNFFSLSLGEVAWLPGGGLKGIFNHSQAAGSIIGLLLTASFYYLSYQQQYTNHYQLLTIIGVAQLIMTNSRTALFAIVISVVITLFLNNSLHKILKFLFSVKGLFMLLLLITSIVVFNQEVTYRTRAFLLKREQTLNVDIKSYDFLENRRIVYAKQFLNIEKYPYLGIGFGMPTEFKFLEKKLGVIYIPSTQIPISYPIEKGVLITALWEETGAIGLGLFSILMFIFSYPFFKKKNNEYAFIMYSTAFILNLGEFVFFATNGLGPFIYFTIVISKIASQKQHSHVK